MGSGGGINQLSVDPQFASRFADAAFEDVTNPQLAPNLLHIHRPALVGETGVPGDNEEPAHSGQRGDDLFDHTIRKVLLVTLATQVIEWQDRDGRLAR